VRVDAFVSYGEYMDVALKAVEALVNPIDVWANQTQKSTSLSCLDSPRFREPTIVREVLRRQTRR